MALSRDRILSQPCEVHWCGFRSNTSVLQQAGWELAVEESYLEGSIRLLMRHQDLNLHAFSAHTMFDFHRNAHEYTRPPTFNVLRAATRFEVMRVTDNFGGFRQIDAMPQFVNSEIKCIEDLGIFMAPLVRTEEIIVAPADVSAMLEQIREMQSPEQAEIRARERSRSDVGRIPGSRPAQQFHAQIISLDSYRAAA